MSTATHIALTSEEYHARDEVGASMLEDFRDSRRAYHAIHVAKTEPKPEPSDAMRLGTLVHLRILQSDRYADCVAEPLPELAPDGKKWLRRKGSDHEAWWQAELESRRGKIAATVDELDAVEKMAANVLANKHARRILERAGTPEFPIFWTDVETGLECKCMVDFCGAVSVDMKTTRDPSPAAFAKQCVELGYHRKRAHYLAGLQRFTGEKDPLFVHLAVGNQWPYSVVVYELDDLDFAGRSLGYKQWRDTVRALVECHATGDWSEPYEREVVRLSLPGYAFSQDQFTVF